MILDVHIQKHKTGELNRMWEYSDRREGILESRSQVQCQRYG